VRSSEGAASLFAKNLPGHCQLCGAMTKKAFLQGLRGGPPPHRPISLAHPGNAHLTACACGHAPDEHAPLAGCIALVASVLGGDEDTFCDCLQYEVGQ
jgi:hypothetical protein